MTELVETKKHLKGNFKDQKDLVFYGSIATGGVLTTEAVEEFETVTGEDTNAEGCPCCGQPHYFYEE
jgi:hypothetical protein